MRGTAFLLTPTSFTDVALDAAQARHSMVTSRWHFS